MRTPYVINTNTLHIFIYTQTIVYIYPLFYFYYLKFGLIITKKLCNIFCAQITFNVLHHIMVHILYIRHVV
jgi:hypothetical protein